MQAPTTICGSSRRLPTQCTPCCLHLNKGIWQKHLAAHGLQGRHERRVQGTPPRATTEEEREIEQMKAEAVKGGILDSELVGTLIKVAVVAVSVAVSVGIAKVAEPIIQTTIAAFPVN
ncbi:uncharacterized protein HaLaN_12742 [Haematococcus lacustris]|uniref:Uncharacterized protein n=1 Tax=Haematococcus lacustris TaxID=44745 RepID=A0A699Z459_HAELA|nr:uncharacterized protein HaLaN_12742 [Haematococcus lacustris]